MVGIVGANSTCENPWQHKRWGWDPWTVCVSESSLTYISIVGPSSQELAREPSGGYRDRLP